MARKTSDVTTWAEGLPPEFLACRDMGHAWRSWRAWKDTRARCFVQVLRCERCRTERERELSLRGERLSQTYRYPETTEGEASYLAPKGSGAFTSEGRADLRLLSLERLVGEQDQAPPADLARARRKKKTAGTKPATTKTRRAG